jgi:type II secretion system protein N
LLKGFLIGAGILVALAVLGLIGMNLYVQSAGTQRRIERALGGALKVPVHITSTIVTPWSGLKASGITVPQVPPMEGNFFNGEGFTARFEWMALLKHRLNATQVSLDNPTVEWFQSGNGRWDLPRIPAAPAASPAPAAAPAKSVETPKWEIVVHQLAVNNACFDFWDHDGNRLAQFAGVRFNTLNPRVTGAQGHAVCSDISARGVFFIRDMSTDWSYQHGLLKLSSFQAGVGGGQLRGQGQMATQVKHSPFTVDVSFDGVNANKLMTDAGQPEGEITGTLKGWLDLYGNPGKTSSINGSAHLEVAGGRLQKLEILETLGMGLGIPELAQLDFKTAQADARVVGGIVHVDKLLLQSGNLELTAQGTIDLDGKLALNARLTVNQAIVKRLPSIIVDFFQSSDTGDTRFIDFQIGNTLSDPKTHLLEKLQGVRIQGQMLDMFNTLFKRKHHKAEPDANGPQP